MEQKNIFTLPNILTLIRLILSPLLLPIFLVYLLPFNSIIINYILAFLFMCFSITDFFDGYFARKWNQVSILGTMLDPIADKFLLYSVLIALLAAGKIFFYWVLLLIGREFFIMSLRLIALEQGYTIPVSFWAKVKTAIEMAYITIIIINPYQANRFQHLCGWNGLEFFLLIVTIGMSLLTAHWYYQEFRNNIAFAKKDSHDIPF